MSTAVVCAVAAIVVSVLPTALRPGPRSPVVRIRRASDHWAGEVAQRLIRVLSGRRTEDRVGALCAAMCAELRAGAAPESALLAATVGNPIAPRARAAAALGEPVAPALLSDARGARTGGLAGVAACWAASADSGAGLADGLERVAALSRAERRVAADLESETAGPRATARVLAALPLMGLAFGELLGARPIAWLLGSPAGWACLLVGAGFLAVGALWTRRIIAAAAPASGGLPR